MLGQSLVVDNKATVWPAKMAMGIWLDVNAGFMDLLVTMKPFWWFLFSSGTSSRNISLLFLEKMPLGTGCIWGSPSTWALTHWARGNLSLFILQRRSEQLATQAPATRPWQGGKQNIRDVDSWLKILPSPFGSIEGLPALGLVWGILVYLLSDNSFWQHLLSDEQSHVKKKHQKNRDKK